MRARRKCLSRCRLAIYSLAFLPSALREWEKLGANVREQFKAKLTERLDEPHITSARLSGITGCYKIKLRAAGYRLVYRVDDGDRRGGRAAGS